MANTIALGRRVILRVFVAAVTLLFSAGAALAQQRAVYVVARESNTDSFELRTLTVTAGSSSLTRSASTALSGFGVPVVSRDGLRVFVVGTSSIQVVDPEIGQVVRQITLSRSVEVSTLRLSADGSRLWADDRVVGGLISIDLLTGNVSTLHSLGQPWALGTNGPQFAVSDDQTTLIVAYAGSATVVTLTTGTQQALGPARGVGMTPNRSRFFVLTENELRVLDGATLTELDTETLPGPFFMSVAPSGEEVLLYQLVNNLTPCSDTGTLRRYRPATGQLETVYAGSFVGELTWAWDSAAFGAAGFRSTCRTSSSGGYVQVGEVGTWSPLSSREGISSPLSVAIGPGRCATPSTTRVLVRDARPISIPVDAPAGCGWRASTSSDGFTVETTQGVGPGAVTVVPPSTPRSGTVTVAGTTVSVIWLSSHGALDGSASGSTRQPFALAGWALDRDVSGSVPTVEPRGIRTVHVWAYPEPGSGRAPIFVGEDTTGDPRPDVQAIFGPAFSATGFSVLVNNLPPGVYQFVAFAQSHWDLSFQPYTVTLSVAAPTPALMGELDSLDNGRTLSQPVVVSGWAFDGNDTATVGIAAVHVWAFPVGGGAPVFVPVAFTMRSDIRDIFGVWRLFSGFSGVLDGVADGTYDIVAYLLSSSTGQFEKQLTKRVTLAGRAQPGAIWVSSLPAPTFGLDGYAMDLRASTGAGVSTVHVWAFPDAGSTPVFLGAVTPSTCRPELVTTFSHQFGCSGWSLSGLSLPPGTYTIAAYALSTASGGFLPPRLVTLTIGS